MELTPVNSVDNPDKLRKAGESFDVWRARLLQDKGIYLMDLLNEDLSVQVCYMSRLNNNDPNNITKPIKLEVIKSFELASHALVWAWAEYGTD